MPDEINRIIRQRRSHFPKEFTGQVLEDQIIRQCLENAHWAPSHKLTFPWRFVVLGQAQVKDFFNLAKEDYLGNSDLVNPAKLDKLSMMAENTSHIIGIICCPSGLVPEWEEQASCAMAVQNMYLTLSQFENAGGYWSTGLRTNQTAMRSFYECRENEIHMGNFMLGYIKAKREEAARPDYMNHLKWDK